ncbi:MAG: DUF2911 domain-containing protein [Sphingobacteriales bacterium]|nr:DUF2911 domain-containing protein [Sphingobacteriales bacterium]
MKKPLYLAAFVFLFLSCNDGKEDTQATAAKNDSNGAAITRPEKPSINPYVIVDISPMDMCYYPVDYPKLKMTHSVSTPPLARVIYSRPHLQGRHIFHEVLKYDEPWRLGANEATELDLYKDVLVQGRKIKAGRYTLYCIPHPDNWTIAINSNTDTWGLEQDTARDVARFTVPVIKTQNSLEYFTMLFEQKEQEAILLMAWDDVEVRLPFTFR